MKLRTFHISNFGCRTSQSEGASIAEELLDAACTETASPDNAGVVIVNSCTVTGEADRQVRQTIRRIASHNPAAQIIVTGCYAQRAPEELRDLPQVRYVVGNSHKSKVGGLARKVFDEDDSTHGRAEIFCSSIFLERDLKAASHFGSGGRTRAVVKVQDGCNANCSFCVIPSVRGRSRSMPADAVLNEIRELVARGYKEVVLSGIHLGTYGRDLDVKTSLYRLVCSILEIAGMQRVRLSSIEPLEVTREVIDLAATHPRVASHFHIPMQSGSTPVLRAMRRPYTADYYRGLVTEVRNRLPAASIGADVMVGFPGESDEHFLETYRLIDAVPLTYLHVFPFSPRPGTPAAEMPHFVPDHVAKYRAKALRQLIAKKNEAFRASMIGRELDVLVLEDDGDADKSGRTGISDNFLRVQLPEGVPVNEWIRAWVTGLTENGVQASSMTTAHEIR